MMHQQIFTFANISFISSLSRYAMCLSLMTIAFVQSACLDQGMQTLELRGLWTGTWEFNMEPLNYKGDAILQFYFDDETNTGDMVLELNGEFFDDLDDDEMLHITGPFSELSFDYEGTSNLLGDTDLHYNKGFFNGNASPIFSENTTILGYASEKEIKIIISFFGFDQTNIVLTQISKNNVNPFTQLNSKK